MAAFKTSSRFGPSALFNDDTPVTLPPGRFKLGTSPLTTGSAPVSNTIGIVLVAAIATCAAAVLPGVTMTLTRRRTRPAASSGKRSYWPSDQIGRAHV